MKVPIIPYPRKVVVYSDSNYFNLNTKIIIGGISNTKLFYSAKQLSQSILSKIGFEPPIEKKNSKNGIQFSLINSFNSEYFINPEAKDEAYKLFINHDVIKIEALTEKGIYYGTMSLIQLIENSPFNKLKTMEIIDWPDMKIRGISDDISRGQVSTLKNFKRIIKFISRYKMNTYMPYIEDVFQFDSFPTIGKDRGALTKNEVKELVEYAKEHFVDVIPIFQTLGHYENILTTDKFLKYAEFPGAASLNISNKETYIFLETLLKEIFEVFPSEYFHMGADESYDVGLGKSKFLVDSLGIAETHLLHYKRVYDICKKYGKKVMMYGDILLQYPEIIEKLPKDIIIVNWRYHPKFEYPSVTEFQNSELTQIVSPSVWNFLTTFPNYTFAQTNIKNFISTGKSQNVIGMINSNWGDFGAETLKELVLYGYAWSAQCSWNNSASNIKDFNTAFFNDFFAIHDEKISFIYEKLSSIPGLVFWNDAWMHPLTKRKYPAWWELKLPGPVKAEWINQNLIPLKPLLNKYKNEVSKNKDHFDILDFVIDFNSWYGLKLKTSEKLKFILAGKDNDTLSCISLIDENISRLDLLKEQHANLWQQYYKKDNLNMIIDKYNRMISYFTEIKQQILKKQLKSPLIKSKWIKHPNSDTTVFPEVKFIKSFTLKGKIKFAKLQLMADTYAELYINDKYVNKVYAKRTGSLFVEYKRIKFLDVSKYLSQGDNKIEVKAKNFNGNAGINIDAFFITDAQSLELITDETWLVTQNEIGNAMKSVTYNYPYNIIAPNFETGRTSWIER